MWNSYRRAAQRLVRALKDFLAVRRTKKGGRIGVEGKAADQTGETTEGKLRDEVSRKQDGIQL